MKDTIVVHCSDTPVDMDIGVAEIRDWHVNDNGWKDVGYAVIIRRDGTIESGRDLDNDGDVFEEVGAHAAGFNTNSIGVCLVGGRGADGSADCNFTLAQYISLSDIVDSIRDCHEQEMKLIGHRDISSKQCPTFDVVALLSKKK